MKGVSYVRAGAACLPIFGPLISCYNSLEIASEQFSQVMDTASSVVRYMMTGGKAFVSTLRGQPATFPDRQSWGEQVQTSRSKQASVQSKSHIYSSCGIVGDLLSIATVYKLVASNILGPGLGIAFAIGFVFQAVDLGTRLNK